MGAVSMSSCHPYCLRLRLFGLLLVGLKTAASAAPPPTIQGREAGFYTTRFGRSDPAMDQARLQELKSRFSPELGPNQPDEWQAGHRAEKKMYTTRYGRSHKEKKMYTTRYGRSDPALLEED